MLRTISGPLSIPAIANIPLMQSAFILHKNTLDDWLAPVGIEVIEIVGTGLPTMQAVAYREIYEGEVCITVNNGSTICTPKKILKPYAQLTKYGDQTVVQESAGAYEGEKKKFFVDISSIKKNNPGGKFQHANFTEIPEVQQLVSEILLATSTTQSSFISTSTIQFNDAYTIVIIDSPVRMMAIDETG